MNHKTDTSPRIAEHGVHWARTFGEKTTNDNWCITDWYNVENAPVDSVNIQGFVGDDASYITFQYRFNNDTTDWYYFAGVNPRKIPSNVNRKMVDITFSIQEAEIDNSYAYLVETGQILFAGKNTVYYGHRNISELT